MVQRDGPSGSTTSHARPLEAFPGSSTVTLSPEQGHREQWLNRQAATARLVLDRMAGLSNFFAVHGLNDEQITRFQQIMGELTSLPAYERLGASYTSLAHTILNNLRSVASQRPHLAQQAQAAFNQQVQAGIASRQSPAMGQDRGGGRPVSSRETQVAIAGGPLPGQERPQHGLLSTLVFYRELLTGANAAAATRASQAAEVVAMDAALGAVSGTLQHREQTVAVAASGPPPEVAAEIAPASGQGSSAAAGQRGGPIAAGTPLPQPSTGAAAPPSPSPAPETAGGRSVTQPGIGTPPPRLPENPVSSPTRAADAPRQTLPYNPAQPVEPLPPAPISTPTTGGGSTGGGIPAGPGGPPSGSGGGGCVPLSRTQVAAIRRIIEARLDLNVIAEHASQAQQSPERLRALEAARDREVSRIRQLQNTLPPALQNAAAEAANGSRSFSMTWDAAEYATSYQMASGQAGPVPPQFEFGFIEPNGDVRLRIIRAPSRDPRPYVPSERPAQPGLGPSATQPGPTSR